MEMSKCKTKYSYPVQKNHVAYLPFGEYIFVPGVPNSRYQVSYVTGQPDRLYVTSDARTQEKNKNVY